jgi:hypothetical protein
MNTSAFETNGDKPQSLQPQADRAGSSAFSWSKAMNLPILNQTRFRSVSCELSEPWMDTSLEGKIIRSHTFFL